MPGLKKYHWYVIIPALALIIFVVGGSLWVRSLKEIDKTTGCGDDITRKTVIVIDHSQPVSKQTQDEIIRRILSFIHRRVEIGELVSVFTLNDLSRHNLAPVFYHCLPRSKGNDLNEDTEAVKEEFKKTFEQPLRDILQTPLGESKETHMAEALIDLSLSGYMDVGDPDSKEERGIFKGNKNVSTSNLIIFSDMMENSDYLSLYHSHSAEEAIKQFLEKRAGGVQRPSFKNVKIYIHIIPRFESKMTSTTVKCRNRFWQWFFGDNKCSCTEAEQGTPCECMFLDSPCNKVEHDQNCYCLCLYNLPG